MPLCCSGGAILVSTSQNRVSSIMYHLFLSLTGTIVLLPHAEDNLFMILVLWLYIGFMVLWEQGYCDLIECLFLEFTFYCNVLKIKCRFIVRALLWFYVFTDLIAAFSKNWQRYERVPLNNASSCQAREDERSENFARLVMLDREDLLPNPEPVDCRICFVDLQPRDGVLLRECLHCFCK